MSVDHNFEEKGEPKRGVNMNGRTLLEKGCRIPLTIINKLIIVITIIFLVIIILTTIIIFIINKPIVRLLIIIVSCECLTLAH